MKMEDIEDVFLQVPDTDPNTGEEDPFAGEARYYSGVEKYFWNRYINLEQWFKLDTIPKSHCIAINSACFPENARSSSVSR